MEGLRILLNDEDFDDLVHNGAKEMGDLKVALKKKATAGDNPGVVIAFTAIDIDGRELCVQATTTLALLENAVNAMKVRARS